MMKSKLGALIGSVAGIFAIVYGTALLFRIFFENYMFGSGLLDMNYAILAAGCAVPFALLIVFGGEAGISNEVLIVGGALFAVLFTVVHWVLASSSEMLEAGAVLRGLIVFPIVALILLLALRLAVRKNAN